MVADQTLILHQYALALGAMPTADSIEQLEMSTLIPGYMDWQGHTVRHAFIQPYCVGEDFNARLCQLLQLLVAKLKAQQNTDLLTGQSIIYLVLPELSTTDSSVLNTLIQHIMRNLPGLLQSAQCRIFAQGSAGALMALAAAQTLLQHQSKTPIWLLSVDSLCSATAFERYRQNSASHVLSEGAVALCLGGTASDTANADSGLQLLFSAVDATTGHSSNDATGNVLRQAAGEALKRTTMLGQLYMPDCGDDRAGAVWLEQYHWLRGAVDADTTFCMPAYLCGELGASGGLYRLLHLLCTAAKGRLPSLTLQYEQSLQHYRTAALFAVKVMDN